MGGIVIAGVNSNVGKTTITLGIMKALVKRKLKVQAYKVGPDYIDPAFHTHVTNTYSRNLDSWMLNEETIKYLYHKNLADSDIAIVEGVMGMYDGFSGDSEIGSTAHVSKILNLPVVLVIDGSGIAASAAAIVKGFATFDKKVNIAGVIINKVHGEKHYDILRKAIEKYTDVLCLGYVNKDTSISLESRHLGLVPSDEVDQLDEKINIISQMIEETLDIGKLIDLSVQNNSNYNLKDNKIIDLLISNKNKYKDVKIGVALDKAFNFYYKDNLDLLEYFGAKIKYFSPMSDDELPKDVSLIYFGGGFPEVFAKKLTNNTLMINSIKDAFNKKMPIYAECGGLMYLTGSIKTLNGDIFQMCSIINGKSQMTKRLQRFGYIEVNTTKDSIVGKKNTNFKAHEFHRSIVISDDEKIFDVSKKREFGNRNWLCGYKKKNLLASYSHIHFFNNVNIALNLLENAEKFRKESLED
ncbi:cobyrinate a,c-diamide synthase [Helicovermis profundi]|uniref:Cobyrinate a,c-diamide synthase n=1 Tax=Helicovermis profundi TaxID=3065157 RepID=A0AAU9E423_9FIRM|nr:cobyrinate a,c-diamide synthase [Clostridia bacterium S502]